MPELPEVETVVRDLKAARLEGAVIRDVRVFWPRTVAAPSVPVFTAALRGKTISAVSRRGKYIVLRLKEGGTFSIHLRMTGRLDFAAGGPRGPHEHVILFFEDGRELKFRDPRKFGRWCFSENGNGPLLKLGPEPLDEAWTEEMFRHQILKRNRMLKPLLLDQTFLAGLGNIYVDEALWEAGLHPARSSRSLNEEESGRLYRAIRKVLRAGIENLGTSLGKTNVNFYSVGGRRGRHQDALKVFRRTGEPCPRCGSPILRLVLAQRGTHLCLTCQKKATRPPTG